MSWSCAKCGRTFRRANQRHACGVGTRERLVRGRPAELVELYGALEAVLAGFGDVEIMTRDRYALFRTTRIFADMVFMSDALRLVIHLDREARDPLFFKVSAVPGRRVAHVAKLRSAADLARARPYLEEAFRASVADEPPPRVRRRGAASERTGRKRGSR